MTKSFKDRLKAIMRGGNLTVTDLAQWFDCKRPTVNYWLGGVMPMENKKDLLDRRLTDLEYLVRDKKSLPVPLSVLRHQRRDFIEALKHHANHPIPPTDSAPKRNKAMVG